MDKIEEKKATQILFESLKGKVDFQLNADNGLDTKSGVLLGLIGTIVVFYLPQLQNRYCYFSLIPIMTLGISAYFLFRALKVRDYNTGLIDVYDEIKGYRSKSEGDLLNQLLSDYQKAFDDNNKIIKEKNVDYRSALYMFVFSIILMVILIFI